jgi:hypothetical protein
MMISLIERRMMTMLKAIEKLANIAIINSRCRKFSLFTQH